MENDNNFLYYHKWTVEDYELYKSSFSNEQMGELFFTVMQSVKTGEKINIDNPTLSFAYNVQYNNLIKSQSKYMKKCETNRQNGSKGGKKKAENAKKRKEDEATKEQEAKTESETYKLPKKTVLKDMVKRIAHNEGHYYFLRNLFYSDEFITILFDSLSAEICDPSYALSFRSKSELEVYILFELLKSDRERNDDLPNYEEIKEDVKCLAWNLFRARGKFILDDTCNTDCVRELYSDYDEKEPIIKYFNERLERLIETDKEIAEEIKAEAESKNEEPQQQNAHKTQNIYGGF